ncbi:MAG: hypothetical protein H0Z35_10975 [Thermoanaerobacteraceae bacterium]|nr:hypothetical protein [Thermoanaerobacteraceae bacterium]
MKKGLFLGLLLLLVLALVAGCGQPAEEPTGSDKQPAEQAEQTENTDSQEPAEAKVAEYVGLETCAGCHADKAEGLAQTIHVKMLQEASEETFTADFTKEGNPLDITGLSKEDIKYTIGSKWKQRYVVEQDGSLRILPKQWIEKTQEWTDYHANDWQERAYEDLCIGCHTTGYNPETETFADPGVTCEACHGPGSLHVENPTKVKPVKISELSPERQIDICGSCHVRGKNKDGKREDALGFKPGDKLTDYYEPLVPSGKDEKRFYANGDSKSHHQQYNDFVQSKHYEAGLTCTTCHDPHNKGVYPGQLKDTPENLCFSCHSEEDLGKPFDLRKYMPKRAKSATPGDITTHTFRPVAE